MFDFSRSNVSLFTKKILIGDEFNCLAKYFNPDSIEINGIEIILLLGRIVLVKLPYVAVLGLNRNGLISAELILINCNAFGSNSLPANNLSFI